MPNRITREVRELLRPGVEGAAEKVCKVVDELLDSDPAAGVKAWAMVAEFVAPKLGRTEVTGADGEPLEFVLRDLAKESPNGKA